MDEDAYRNPLTQARVTELLAMPKAQLVALALPLVPDVRSRAPAATLARWRKQELAWCIACAEFAGGNGPRDP